MDKYGVQTMEEPGPGQDVDLFSDESAVSKSWFVLHTKSRQEKALAEDLASLGVSHFLPLIKQVRHYGRRKISVALPLFPGYLFVRGRKERIYLADRSKRLVSVISVSNQVGLNWELRNLNLALSNHVGLDPFPFLKSGVRVEVRSGPLRGLQGLVEARNQTNRLVLQVEMLGRAMSMEIEASLLDPV